MKEAGCNYISISPESGSKRVLDLMNNPIDIEHAYSLIRSMNKLGIISQTCFIIGYPGETDEDRKQTLQVALKLARLGADEVVASVVTPVPGSKIFGEIKGYKHLSELNFSPSWRADYKKLLSCRLKLYSGAILTKALFHPLKILSQLIYFIRKHYKTKMEMTFYRYLKYKFMPFTD